MKKTKWVLVTYCLLFILSACNIVDSDYQQMQGVVKEVDTQNNRILLIAELTEGDLNKDTQEVIKSGEYREVAWVSKIDSSKFTVGEEIIIYYEAREDSYPGKMAAKKYEKLTSK
ncbi:DUF3221 domain-containing protein [Paenibacillus glucanolyticus]|uniref:DUF3221 domain-containing protein n=1 Tax=Paenibacillus glucanolyticus TaxID=59843 RepID=UPI00096C10FA|nr:DUF3221 domain-containing protein [Paenibacillus glucanolyticus]OMF68466.1 hypothetical protein BK142_27235 [Paenibacillus glucanolyticus]